MKPVIIGNNTLYQGDALHVLPTLPEKSFHACITSPPYWGLRDYGTGGQIGLEKTPEEFVQKIVAVFRQVHRVLRDDGTLWLNLGDSYCNTPRGNKPGDTGKSGLTNPQRQDGLQRGGRDKSKIQGVKHKDLVGIPWMVAFALRADGWYLRSEIIWHKPNAMCESVTDRPSKSHEQLFLLTKKPKYFYDHVAVREPMSKASASRYKYAFGGSKAEQLTAEEADGPGTRTHPIGNREAGDGRNKRSVWTVPTHPFPGAHFATFPPKLVLPCLLAGTSEHGCCPACGSPFLRQVEYGDPVSTDGTKSDYRPTKATDDPKIKGRSEGWTPNHVRPSRTTGWKASCKCPPGEPIPAHVLDPFSGAATVGLVCTRKNRRFSGIELSPDYLSQIATPRLQNAWAQEDLPLF